MSCVINAGCLDGTENFSINRSEVDAAPHQSGQRAEKEQKTISRRFSSGHRLLAPQKTPKKQNIAISPRIDTKLTEN